MGRGAGPRALAWGWGVLLLGLRPERLLLHPLLWGVMSLLLLLVDLAGVIRLLVGGLLLHALEPLLLPGLLLGQVPLRLVARVRWLALGAEPGCGLLLALRRDGAGTCCPLHRRTLRAPASIGSCCCSSTAQQRQQDIIIVVRGALLRCCRACRCHEPLLCAVRLLSVVARLGCSSTWRPEQLRWSLLQGLLAHERHPAVLLILLDLRASVAAARWCGCCCSVGCSVRARFKGAHLDGRSRHVGGGHQRVASGAPVGLLGGALRLDLRPRGWRWARPHRSLSPSCTQIQSAAPRQSSAAPGGCAAHREWRDVP